MIGRPPTSLLLATILVISGCVGGGEETAPKTTSIAPAPPPAPTVEYGSIEGVVVDEEQVPVVGAEVAIKETQQGALTDDAGVFVFNNLTAGTYTVLVAKLGFASEARTADVFVGQVAPVTISMKAVEIKPDPFVLLFQFEGMLHCSYNPVYAINPCEPVTGANKDKFVFDIVEGKLKDAVFEAVWAPATAVTGQTLELDVCKVQTDQVNNKLLCYSTGYNKYETGKSPLKLYVTDMPYKETKQFVTGAGSAYDDPTSVSYEQTFTIYASMCYFEDCTENYTALPPA